MAEKAYAFHFEEQVVTRLMDLGRSWVWVSRWALHLRTAQINHVFGQTILPILFHFLGWEKWFENDLEWFEKKYMLNGLTL